MAKDRSEQAMKSRKKRGTVRVELQVLPEIKAKFEELANANQISKVELFARFVEAGYKEDSVVADRARELLEQSGGDRKKATAAFRVELLERYPGFKTKSTLPEHAEARKLYSSFATAMNNEVKKKGTS